MKWGVEKHPLVISNTCPRSSITAPLVHIGCRVHQGCPSLIQCAHSINYTSQANDQHRTKTKAIIDDQHEMTISTIQTMSKSFKTMVQTKIKQKSDPFCIGHHLLQLLIQNRSTNGPTKFCHWQNLCSR